MFPLSDQAGTPAAPTPSPVEPAADQPGKKKPPTPEREIGSSVKVAKSFGIVAKVGKVAQSSES